MMMMFQAPILKRMAMQFVVRNMSSVVRSRDWKECLLDHPALMAEVGYFYCHNISETIPSLFRLWRRWHGKTRERDSERKDQWEIIQVREEQKVVLSESLFFFRINF